jgi:hypothetical protein
MKLTKKLFGFTVIFAVIGFLALPLTGCPADDDDPTPTPTPPGGKTVTFDYTGDNVADFATWLAAQPDRAQPYNVKLNVGELSDRTTTGSLGNIIWSNTNKYINLDLSGSTFTDISAAFSRPDSSPFYGCISLVSVTLPNTITRIGYYAFYSAGLTSITIPNTVTSIGQGAFNDCAKLASITIPNTVTSIGDAAFSGCSSLVSVTLPNTITSIGYAIFGGCTKLASITIPNTVTSIKVSAFYGCTKLASITIPASVTSIGNSAFGGCSSLVSVTFQGTIPAADFGPNDGSFFGDLRDKFYATNATNGTAGTYTTTAPVSDTSVWTKRN